MYVRHIETERNRFMVIYLMVASALLVFLPNLTDKYELSVVVKLLIIGFFAMFTIVTFRYVYTQKKASLFYRKQIDDLIEELWAGKQNAWYSNNRDEEVQKYLEVQNEFATNKLKSFKGTFIRQFMTYVTLALLMHVAYSVILFQKNEVDKSLSIKVSAMNPEALESQIDSLKNRIEEKEFIIKLYEKENKALKDSLPQTDK